MSMALLDDMKNKLQELELKTKLLEEKDKEIKKYQDLLLTNRRSGSGDEFLVYSTAFDEDSVNIIGQHITEFGEFVYDCGFQLDARKECNREFNVYLVPFEGNTDLEEIVKKIDKLIDEKRKEEEENVDWPKKRIVCEVKSIRNTLKTQEENRVNELDIVKEKLDKVAVKEDVEKYVILKADHGSGDTGRRDLNAKLQKISSLLEEALQEKSELEMISEAVEKEHKMETQKLIHMQNCLQSEQIESRRRYEMHRNRNNDLIYKLQLQLQHKDHEKMKLQEKLRKYKPG